MAKSDETAKQALAIDVGFETTKPRGPCPVAALPVARGFSINQGTEILFVIAQVLTIIGLAKEAVKLSPARQRRKAPRVSGASAPHGRG